MTRLDARSRIPEPGWMFRITALHTCDTQTPWLTGTWHRAGTQPPDPACALWLILAEQAGGQVTVGLLADHEQTPTVFLPLARLTGLDPAAWTSAIAPQVAAHPYTTHLHHPKPRKSPDRAARAILAYLVSRH